MKAQKAEIKAQKAKIKGNEGPNDQNLENEAGPGLAKFFIWDKGKTDRSWQLVAGASRAPQRRQEGNEGPKGQNKRK